MRTLHILLACSTLFSASLAVEHGLSNRQCLKNVGVVYDKEVLFSRNIRVNLDFRKFLRMTRESLSYIGAVRGKLTDKAKEIKAYSEDDNILSTFSPLLEDGAAVLLNETAGNWRNACFHYYINRGFPAYGDGLVVEGRQAFLELQLLMNDLQIRTQVIILFPTPLAFLSPDGSIFATYSAGESYDTFKGKKTFLFDKTNNRVISPQGNGIIQSVCLAKVAKPLSTQRDRSLTVSKLLALHGTLDKFSDWLTAFEARFVEGRNSSDATSVELEATVEFAQLRSLLEELATETFFNTLEEEEWEKVFSLEGLIAAVRRLHAYNQYRIRIPGLGNVGQIRELAQLAPGDEINSGMSFEPDRLENGEHMKGMLYLTSSSDRATMYTLHSLGINSRILREKALIIPNRPRLHPYTTIRFPRCTPQPEGPDVCRSLPSDQNSGCAAKLLDNSILDSTPYQCRSRPVVEPMVFSTQVCGDAYPGIYIVLPKLDTPIKIVIVCGGRTVYNRSTSEEGHLRVDNIRNCLVSLGLVKIYVGDGLRDPYVIPNNSKASRAGPEVLEYLHAPDGIFISEVQLWIAGAGAASFALAISIVVVSYKKKCVINCPILIRRNNDKYDGVEQGEASAPPLRPEVQAEAKPEQMRLEYVGPQPPTAPYGRQQLEAALARVGAGLATPLNRN